MQSMTGFGRGTHSTGSWTASVEAASVNRKQAEIVANMPRQIQVLEGRVRQATSPHVSRGRVQLSIRLERLDGEISDQIRINPALARSFESAFADLSILIGRQLLPTPADFLRQPGIMEIGETETVDPDEAWEVISPALEQALANLNTMRAEEGRHLKDDFLARLGQLMAFTQMIADHAPSRPVRQRELLMKRLSDLGLPLSSPTAATSPRKSHACIPISRNSMATWTPPKRRVARSISSARNYSGNSTPSAPRPMTRSSHKQLWRRRQSWKNSASRSRISNKPFNQKKSNH
jgi:uncharacterized protein YicC (UPF0701 family)